MTDALSAVASRGTNAPPEASEPPPPAVGGLFAGIGGFELGFARAGYRTTMLCEIDPIARAVLRTRLKGVDIAEDVRDVAAVPGVTVLCAGFPCQDLSSTGPKDGVAGARSSLVGEVFRLLQAHPVEWVVLENVPFMLHLQGGAAMRMITAELQRLEYSWAYRVIDSHAFGLPQRRRRVYLVASRDHDPRSVLLAGEAPPPVVGRRRAVPIGFYWTEGTRSSGLALNAVPPLKSGSTIGIPSPPAILFPNGMVATPEIRDAERLQGFPADWTLPAEEIARGSMRWKLVGNAVAVPVGAWIAGRIREPAAYDASGDLALSEGHNWPSAAWCLGGRVHESSASHYPVAIPSGGLIRFLRYPVRSLSTKATKGFLRRARAGGLHFPAGFLDALDRHASGALVTKAAG
jgi:DNA (cytosine-5)-methyltransferase 1